MVGIGEDASGLVLGLHSDHPEVRSTFNDVTVEHIGLRHLDCCRNVTLNRI